MKTIKYKTVNTLKVVIGFDRLLVNAVATQRIMDGLIKENVHFKKMQELSSAISTESLKGKKIDHEKMAKMKIQSKNERKLLESELNEQYKDNAIHFEPRKNEIAVSDEVVEEFNALLEQAHKNKQAVLTDKTMVPNLINEKYYLKEGEKIIEKTISEIGEDFPLGCIKELNEEDSMKFEIQKEEERILKMNEIEKDSAFSKLKSEVINQILIKTMELELDGFSHEEAKAQAMTEGIAKIDELKVKYSQS